MRLREKLEVALYGLTYSELHKKRAIDAILSTVLEDGDYIRRKSITSAMAAQVLLDMSYDDRSCGFNAVPDAPAEFGGWAIRFLHAIATQEEEKPDD